MANHSSGHGLPDDVEQRAPRSHKRVGEIVNGKYEVTRFLGEGGVGVVYEVRHRVIGRRFAMKFLHEDVSRKAAMVTRFRREAEAAGRLECENVVAVVDFGSTQEGTPYLVMEYLDGESLARLLAKNGLLSVSRAVGLVLQLCRGLEAAHARGIIHRDLKPENVFVVPRAEGRDLVKILDFGIAKLVIDGSDGITHSGMTLGTPHYMSPEQARGDPQVDFRTDIYSVGVILYELLTGTKPHPGPNATAVLFHLLKQEPIRVDALREQLARGLANAVHRALAFAAEDRFATVAELSAALVPYCAGQGGAPSAEPVVGHQWDAATLLQATETIGGHSAASRSGAAHGTRDILRRGAWLASVAVAVCAGAAVVAARHPDASGAVPVPSATASVIDSAAWLPNAAASAPPVTPEAVVEAKEAMAIAPEAGAQATPPPFKRPGAPTGQGAPRPTTTANSPPRRSREDLYEP